DVELGEVLVLRHVGLDERVRARRFGRRRDLVREGTAASGEQECKDECSLLHDGCEDTRIAHNAGMVMAKHFVNGKPMDGALPEGMQEAMFALGCFWGAEKKFWQTNGVYVTSVGYAAGHTKNPTYREVCSGSTNHAEVVRVVF